MVVAKSNRVTDIAASNETRGDGLGHTETAASRHHALHFMFEMFALQQP